MKDKEIKTGEYQIVTLGSDQTYLLTNLDHEIAVIFKDLQNKKIGVGKDLNEKKLRSAFFELKFDQQIDVSIIGGDLSEASKEAALMVVSTLSEIDKGRNKINIKSYDVGSKKHPNTLLINCNSGLFGPIERVQRSNEISAASFAAKYPPNHQSSKKKTGCAIQ